MTVNAIGTQKITESARGGTGVANAANITIGGALTFSGAFSFTGTVTGNTAVTFPTSGTLATTAQLPVVTPAALTRTNDTNVTLTLGGTPTTALLQATSMTLGWTGTLSSTRGGTGVNNGSSTITLGGSLTVSGAFTTTFTVTGNTALTLPTSGTLVTTQGPTDLPAMSQGAILYANATNTLAQLPKSVSSRQYLTNSYDTTQNPAWDTIDLADNGVSGNLGVSHLGSGTGATSSTFFRGDATWAAAVTSLATGNLLRGGTITTTGTINLNMPSLQGLRLTLTTGVPVTTADVTAATTIYATPYKSGEISLFDGTNWLPYATTQLSIAVPATTNTAYDVFIYDNAGAPTLELTAWTNVTTRATALVYQNGVYVKTGALTRRYLGSFRTTAVSGQTEDSIANRFLWNYYHRVVKTMFRFDATASWIYASTTVRQANASTANQVNFFIGVSEDVVCCDLNAGATYIGSGAAWDCGVSLDTTSTHSTTGTIWADYFQTSTVTAYISASYRGYPGIGSHYLAWVESTNGSSVTFAGALGTGGDTYRHGLYGTILC